MLLVTKYFVFLHLPKTGGSWVREVCFRNLPREWRIENDLESHASYDDAAERFGDLPMLCFVRNPWDWYVSWYHWLKANPPPEPHTLEERPMWVMAFDRGRSDFATAVRRACTGESFANPRTSETMRELGVDHYSALYRIIAGGGVDAGKVEVGRFERLREDLTAFMERHDVPLTNEFRTAVRGQPAVRASNRAHYRSYYDDELRELVAEKNELVAEYGYSF
jgi:hypothetical protein